MTGLSSVYSGWEGYQASLVTAISSLTPEQLTWRPAKQRRSVGELVRHITLGRVTWFARMGAPGIDEVVARVPAWQTDEDGARHAVEDAVPADDPEVAQAWLYEDKSEPLLGHVTVWDPAIGRMNLVQVSRVGVHHDQHHYKAVRRNLQR